MLGYSKDCRTESTQLPNVDYGSRRPISHAIGLMFVHLGNGHVRMRVSEVKSIGRCLDLSDFSKTFSAIEQFQKSDKSSNTKQKLGYLRDITYS